MNKEKAIEVSELTKKYGSFTAVDNVTFNVTEGEFFGFLGPNGAGKTTLIRILTTLLKPSGGHAVVACHDVAKDPEQVRKEIGVVPQAMTSDLDLTGYENMDLYGRFYGIPSRERKERIGYLLDIVSLSQRANDLVATYSGGMRRRLEIARGLVHKPKILFLDEPTIGLDPQSRQSIWDLLKQFMEGDGMTVFLTTHYMEEAEALCNRVAIIDSGKIVVAGTPPELKAGIPGNDSIELTVDTLPQDLLQKIDGLPFVHKSSVDNNRIRVSLDNGAGNLPGLMDEVRSEGAKVLSASIHEQSLEDVFIHYTGKSIRQEEAKKVSFLVGAGVPTKWGR
jgi:ABC-2 type transport system ATP-binding protein